MDFDPNYHVLLLCVMIKGENYDTTSDIFWGDLWKLLGKFRTCSIPLCEFFFRKMLASGEQAGFYPSTTLQGGLAVSKPFCVAWVPRDAMCMNRDLRLHYSLKPAMF